MGRVFSPPATEMKVFALLFLAAACLASPDPRQMLCEECIEEMHRLNWLVKLHAREIEQYLTANYCPTLPEDNHACDHDLPLHYVEMLYAVVEHYFVDGAVHICQAWGVCHARSGRFTCEECIEGLEWVGAHMTDPLWVAEYVVYLQQNWCTDPRCHQMVAHHFPPMHAMAMQHFWHPQAACNQLPVCGGDGPTKPPQ